MNVFPSGYVPPVPQSSLTLLFRAVQAWFTAYQVDAAVYLGLKYRDLQDQPRVILIDGEFDGTLDPRPRSAGRFRAPWQKKSVDPRELVGWERPVTLSVRAVDKTAPDSEIAQVVATETLLEFAVQAVQNAVSTDPVTGMVYGVGQASVDWGESKLTWVDPGTGTQQTWGKELLVTFIYKCPLFDQALGVAFPVGQLEKNLLSTYQSGVSGSVTSAFIAAETAVIGDLAFRSPADVGKVLALSGAASAENNGSFPIVAFLSPSQLVVSNVHAVAPDANNGSISWSLQPLT